MAVKAWRMETDGQVILNGDWMKCAPVSSPTVAGDDTGQSSALSFSNILG
ncbi:hypothetical protein GGE60_005558 [Rhizobium leucaenae]|uniref:Uncharacterized protein n=1 Tax=Rhizobium leucaenae TaxID=29450 RepID=A0A7W7ENA3_9HYPH|nr:hypothetical protein [Rhizobium leucaenae]